jgi:hypothetical protein
MTKNGFSWEESTWKQITEYLWGFQTRNSNSISVNFPNYDLIYTEDETHQKDAWSVLQVTGGDYELISLASSNFQNLR